MVGLSIVLDSESQSYSTNNNNKSVTNTIDCSTKKVIACSSSQVINKATMIINQKPPSHHHQTLSFATTFLDHCSLCHQKLLPGKDIYMYKGDRAFCSVECRCRQIFMDEEETKSVHKDMCSFSAMKPSSSSSSRPRKGTRNRAL